MKNYNLINMKTINHFLTEAEIEEISQKTKEMYLNVFSNWIDSIYMVLKEIDLEEFDRLKEVGFVGLNCTLNRKLYRPLICSWKLTFLMYVFNVFQFKLKLEKNGEVNVILTIENILYFREVLVPNKEEILEDMREALDIILDEIECIPKNEEEVISDLIHLKNVNTRMELLKMQIDVHNEEIEVEVRGYK